MVASSLIDGRYQVLADLPNLLDQSYISGNELKTYLVQEKQTKHVYSARLAKHGTRSFERLKAHLDVLHRLGIQGPHPLLLAPVETLETKIRGPQYLCAVYSEILGPDLNAMEMNCGDVSDYHEPEVIRHVGSQTAAALEFLHSNGITAGLSMSCPVITYPNLAGSESKTILNFYGYHGTFACLNASCTGPRGTSFNKDAMLYKCDLIDTAMSYGRQLVPETAFGETDGPKSDIWMLGAILLNLACEVPAETYTISHIASKKTHEALAKISPSPYKAIVMTIEQLGDLPPRYVDRLPRDARGAVERRVVKYNPHALSQSIRNNVFAERIPEEKRMSDDELDRFTDLLLRLLAHDPRERADATETLSSPYLTAQ